MIRRPPRSTRTDTLVPDTTLFRSRPVRFEITEQTRDAVDAYLASTERKSGLWLFPGSRGQPMTTRQYARLLDHWLAEIGLEPALFGTHTLRRTTATLISRRTGKLRRSEERRGGEECVRKGRSRGSPYH